MTVGYRRHLSASGRSAGRMKVERCIAADIVGVGRNSHSGMLPNVSNSSDLVLAVYPSFQLFDSTL